ncbi:galactitol-1-phosphate 5-dehydrogenase [Paenibacillus antri]|uniref:Galactitol-1-phosphate 5-dehydrogenase n=2 Tax=Paenibacillus antri TaxID=2582848 RepID=A0A5R9G488_9BACL|nr:galactitol-1-phosphate 5-dehydrogenase [Paenibacillus antri]
MKALVYEGPRQMNMRNVPIPEPGEDEVLVDVKRVGICGSELGGYLGHNSLRKPPLVMGHEFSGVVSKIGRRVTATKIGDRVVANPLVSCERCMDCKTGAPHLCRERQLLGAHRPGAFAERVAVPERNVHPLPDGMSFDEGAFVEPFACAIHVCRLLSLSPEDRLFIAGAGPIGLFALQAAQSYGLRDIVISDVNPERLEIARELGGIAIAGGIDAWKTEHLPGGFDAAVDAVGMEVTRNGCMTAVKSAGRVVFTGLHEADSRLPVNLAIRNEIVMRGAFAYTPYDFRLALQWIGEGKNRLLPWTVHAPLEDGGGCFEKLVAGPGKIAKILLTV